MLKHPKTTWAGVLMLLAAGIAFVAKLLQGHGIEMTDIHTLMAALAGAGFIAAADGDKTS